MASPLRTVLNFRDVGYTVNERTGSNLMQTGRLFRSARPDEASHDDRQRLLNDFKVTTIVDLRTKTEHIEQAQKRDAKIASSEAIPIPDQVAAEPLQIPGINYHNINFNGSAYSKSLIKQLTWYQFSRLVWLMAVGKRTEAISILGVNVMTERGLIGLGLDSLDVCTKEVKEFFEVLANPEAYPVCVHCTQGKDRTGLTIILALLLMDVPLDAVDYDYMITQSQLTTERAQRVKEINSIGLPASFADCDPDFVKQVHQHIQDKYGGIRQYLSHAGVTLEMIQSAQLNLGALV